MFGDFQPFPTSQDLVNHPIETTIDDKWFLFRFQVPAMIMNDPRLRKHPELFEAKIPTSWVAPELLEAWAADWQKWEWNWKAEKVLELRIVMQFTYTYKVSIVNVHIWSLRPDGPTLPPKTGVTGAFTGLTYSPNKTFTPPTWFIFLLTPSIH